jgi:hypothetical protein
MLDRIAAPRPPGRLGEAIPTAALLRYLDELGTWRASRKTELDRIDAAALRAQDADTYTSDLALALTIWQSVSDRLEQLGSVWNSGAVGPAEREAMSRLIWGTGSTSSVSGPGGAPSSTPAGLTLSLVEAVRLCDALTAALRARLAFDPLATDVAARFAATRASVARSVEMLARSKVVRATDVPDVGEMRRRLDDLAARGRAGADVSGPFAVLETEAARLERDLIVKEAAHRNLGRDWQAARERRRGLQAREERLRKLVIEVVAQVTPAPRLAVPDVERLGRVPQTRPELDAYAARLERVALALDQATRVYSAALAERDELRGRLSAFGAKAQARGRTGDSVVGQAYDRAQAVLNRVPCDLPAAREAVAGYQRVVDAAPTATPTPTPTAPPTATVAVGHRVEGGERNEGEAGGVGEADAGEPASVEQGGEPTQAEAEEAETVQQDAGGDQR